MKYAFIFLFSAVALVSNGQLLVDNTPSPEDLVAFLVGDGVEFSNVTFSGDLNQFGTFNSNDSNIGMASGIIMATGDCSLATGPDNAGGASLGGGNFGDGDPDLEVLSGVTTNDRCILEFDFIPAGDSLTFAYVFGSEEYDDFECCGVNDAFGFFISGPGIAGPFTSPAEFPDGSINVALIPDTDIGVSINTVNSGNANCEVSNCTNLDPNFADNTIYFTSNTGGPTVQYDGFTVPMTATAIVECGSTYHIKLAIADGGDTAWDSGVMLEEGSFNSSDPGIAPNVDNSGISIPDNTLIEGCLDGSMIITKPDCDEAATIDITIGGTAGMVADYEFFALQVTFEPGENSAEIPIITVADGITEGTETIEMSFEYVNLEGDTLVATATLDIIDYVPLDLQVEDVFVCPDSFGEGVAQISDGITPYDVEWESGGSGMTEIYNEGSEGSYFAVVTDFCEEQDTAFFDVIEPSPLALGNISSFYCLGLDTDALVSGGTPPYTFDYPTDTLILLEGGGFSSDDPGQFDLSVVDVCEDEIEFELIFLACDTQVPNVFTPTASPNDVFNNVFEISGLQGFPGSAVKVFDRWGQLVYENRNYRNTWDGDENPDGVYYYIFERSDGEIFTGHVSILRKNQEGQ
jgi:gliding motility-associated-like protein